jgi:hypothetical protein
MTESQEYKKLLVDQLIDQMFDDNIIVETVDKINEITAMHNLTDRCKQSEHHVLTGRSTWTITVFDKSYNKKMPDLTYNTSPKVINECDYLRSIYGEQNETPRP